MRQSPTPLPQGGPADAQLAELFEGTVKVSVCGKSVKTMAVKIRGERYAAPSCMHSVCQGHVGMSRGLLNALANSASFPAVRALSAATCPTVCMRAYVMSHGKGSRTLIAECAFRGMWRASCAHSACTVLVVTEKSV